VFLFGQSDALYAALAREMDTSEDKSAVRLAQRARGGEAGYADSMASQGVPLVLALEVQTSWKTCCAQESPGVDSEDGG
jgi:hypothetical protein